MGENKKEQGMKENEDEGCTDRENMVVGGERRRGEGRRGERRGTVKRLMLDCSGRIWHDAGQRWRYWRNDRE